MKTYTTTEIVLDGDWGPSGRPDVVVHDGRVLVTLPDGTELRGDYDTVRESLIDMVEALETAAARSRPDLGATA